MEYIKQYRLWVFILISTVLSSCVLRDITRPTVTQLTQKDPVFMLAFPMRYKAFHSSNYEIVVPAGFITDLASIPEPLWWWESPHEGTMAPAIIHDYLYWEQSCTKDEADAVMYVAMTEVGLEGDKIAGVYVGIRSPIADKAWEDNRKARLGGESRFFTPEHARSLQESWIDTEATLSSLQSDAIAVNGMYRIETPQPIVKRVCQEAMIKYRQYKNI